MADQPPTKRRKKSLLKAEHYDLIAEAWMHYKSYTGASFDDDDDDDDNDGLGGGGRPSLVRAPARAPARSNATSKRQPCDASVIATTGKLYFIVSSAAHPPHDKHM